MNMLKLKRNVKFRENKKYGQKGTGIYYYDYNMKIGILFRLASFWIGIHYSEKCKRFCINVIPCITIWITLEDGIVPDKKLM